MYQPALRPDQIRALYQLKLIRGRPMTALLREAVDAYFAALGGSAAVLPRDEWHANRAVPQPVTTAATAHQRDS